MRHRGGPDASFETLKYKFDLQTKNFFFDIWSIFCHIWSIFGKKSTKYRKKKFLFVSQICILRSQMKDLDPLYVSYINNIQIGHTSIKKNFQNSISENAY